LHPKEPSDPQAPRDALGNPFAYLPPPVEFTDDMAVIANRYKAHDIDWRYYPAFQAAAFLQPKTAEEHGKRKDQFLALKDSAESQGFSVPDALTRLMTTDEYIDRLHHNCIWPSLPEKVIRLPSDPTFAVFLFLREGQGCGIWHLLLSPDGSHTVIDADARFGCTSGYPPGRVRDPATIRVFQCMDSINRLLYHYFLESARDNLHYLRCLEEYFAETGTA
jgi:hypothetical protein